MVIILSTIKAKLLVENARSLADSEIERCLGNCVLKTKLIFLAKKLRDVNILTLE